MSVDTSDALHSPEPTVTPSSLCAPSSAPHTAPVTAPPRQAHGPRGLLARLLSLSLFYKVLIANSAIVLLGAVAGTAITAHIASIAGPRHGAFDAPLAIGFALAGLALTFTLNALILRAALSPLDRLRVVVERGQQGDVSVRARPSPLDDTQLRRLAETLNTMLDEVQRYQEQVRALSGRLIYAHEDERQRIARELHDDTGQVLTLLLIRLKLLESQPGAEAIAPQLTELRGIVTIATTLRLPRARVTLGPERTLAVYRVVQEALTNAAKHARAQRVTVTLSVKERELCAQVRDDGHGFTPESLLARVGQRHDDGAGVGLFGMEERARLAGGSLQVRSAPGKGATVTLCVPLERNEYEELADPGAQPVADAE